MSVMTHDEIKVAIANGEIGAITLDTSIFDGNSLKLESGLLQRVEQFRGSGIQFVLSEIVVNEVLAHLTKNALDAQTHLETAYKGLEKYWLISKEKLDATTIELLQDKTAADLARDRLESFIDTMACQTILAAEHIDVSEMLRRYFAPQPPFSPKENKKNEFPDAFALLSLESWAAKSGKKLLAVSKDGDWVRYCKDSAFLVQVEDLGIALSLFHQDASVACNLLSLQLQSGGLPDLQGMVEESVYRHIERMDFLVEADSSYWLDDEITDYDVKEVVLGRDGDSPPSFEPVDAGTGYLVAKLPISAELKVECDFQFSVKDGIDKDYMSIGAATVRRNVTVQLEVLVTFGGEIPGAPTIDEIEIIGTSRLRVEFGYVEPEWREDPNSEFY